MKNKNIFKVKCHDKMLGFTLAEVLITLTIIGVITALTIPNLSRKWSDHADVQKVKEVYSILSNAMKLIIAENGGFDFPDTGEYKSVNSQYVGKLIADKLKIKKNCIYDGYNCYQFGWNNDGSEGTSNSNVNYLYYKTINGARADNNQNVAHSSALELQNGMLISIGNIVPNGRFNGVLGTIEADINGKAKPNRHGYDVFRFDFNTKGMTPIRGHWNSTGKTNCNKTNNKSESCSEWILKHGNMDYKYRDISTEW